jgi:hypothetical protein
MKLTTITMGTRVWFRASGLLATHSLHAVERGEPRESFRQEVVACCFDNGLEIRAVGFLNGTASTAAP